MRPAVDKLALRARQLRFLLGEVRGVRTRLALAGRLAISRLAPGLTRRSPALATARVPFRRFELEFAIGEGEILNYEPIVRDLEQGVIPTGPGLETWTVLDCGANIGLVSLFLGTARRVVAVEPHPDTCARLRRNLAANGVAATVVEAAVSDKPGTLRIGCFGIFTRVSQGGELVVEATTIDAILEREAIEAVDLLKLDVEGHGFEAIAGARRALAERRVRMICAEYIGAEELRRLDSTLAAHGFERVRTGDANALYELRQPSARLASP